MIWDIVAPKNKWERQYCTLEFKRIGWHNLWNYSRPIEVKDPPSETYLKAIKAIKELEDMAEQMGWNKEIK